MLLLYMNIGLIFSGQGAQKVGMGKSLLQNAEIAQKRYQQAEEMLGFDFQRICFEGPETDLTPTAVCQPALYVQGYIIFELLSDMGKIETVTNSFGLSLGELTSLATAGVVDFTTGLQLVAERGRLMQQACQQTKGAMASLIGGDRESAKKLAQDFDIDISNYNCPGQIVLSGSQEPVRQATAVAKERGFRMAVPLKVAGAYHSRLMESASDAFATVLKTIPFHPPRWSVYSNVSGKSIQEPEKIKTALVDQIVSPVQFEDCLRQAYLESNPTFYECGSGNILAGLAQRTDKNIKVITLNEFSDLQAL